jgi:hypothetical protein
VIQLSAINGAIISAFDLSGTLIDIPGTLRRHNRNTSSTHREQMADISGTPESFNPAHLAGFTVDF